MVAGLALRNNSVGVNMGVGCDNFGVGMNTRSIVADAAFSHAGVIVLFISVTFSKLSDLDTVVMDNGVGVVRATELNSAVMESNLL